MEVTPEDANAMGEMFSRWYDGQKAQEEADRLKPILEEPENSIHVRCGACGAWMCQDKRGTTLEDAVIEEIFGDLPMCEGKPYCPVCDVPRYEQALDILCADHNYRSKSNKCCGNCAKKRFSKKCRVHDFVPDDNCVCDVWEEPGDAYPGSLHDDVKLQRGRHYTC